MSSLRVVILVLGVCACSTAALFIKASQVDPVLIAAWRLLIGGAALMPVFVLAHRRHPEISLRRLIGLALPASILLGLHFWTWNEGVHRAYIANASLIVNMTAPIMPVIVWLLLRERVRRRELLGTAIAFLGVLLLGITDFDLDPTLFLGDLICFASMLLFAVYLAWSRRNRALPSIWLYVTPVYVLSGVLCFIAGWIRVGDPLPATRADWWPLLALAFIPTLVGHSILNYSMQRLPSQVVAVVNLGQFIPAAVLAWFFFAEAPGWDFPVAAVLVIAGALVAMQARRAPDTQHAKGAEEQEKEEP